MELELWLIVGLFVIILTQQYQISRNRYSDKIITSDWWVCSMFGETTLQEHLANRSIEIENNRKKSIIGFDMICDYLKLEKVTTPQQTKLVKKKGKK